LQNAKKEWAGALKELAEGYIEDVKTQAGACAEASQSWERRSSVLIFWEPTSEERA